LCVRDDPAIDLAAAVARQRPSSTKGAADALTGGPDLAGDELHFRRTWSSYGKSIRAAPEARNG
jgi:hypothetical protein